MFNWVDEFGDILIPRNYEEAKKWHKNLTTFRLRISNVLESTDPLGNRFTYTNKYYHQYKDTIYYRLICLQVFMGMEWE